MKNKTNKRAFTIVELVIVIAVIAILAAVLIPTFSNLVKKAQTSKDTQLIRNLNTALSVDKATGNEHNTMTDALKAAKEAGYDVEKINASNTDNEILWDGINDAFCYLEGKELENNNSNVKYLPEMKLETEKGELHAYDYWKIYAGSDRDVAKVADENQTFSIYLGGTDYSEVVVVKVGFDAGENTGITSVTYDRSTATEGQKVVIRTNSASTNLSVNAPLDTVTHYDEVGNVEIIDVDPNHSYHEHGTVTGQLEIAKGHLVIESTASVPVVKVSATQSSDFSIESSYSGTLGVIVADDPAVLVASGENKNITVTTMTGVMDSESQNAEAYSAEKGFLNDWQSIFGEGGEITLLKDVTLTTGRTLANQINIKINLSKNTIAYTSNQTSAFTVTDGAYLKLENGSLNFTLNSNGANASIGIESAASVELVDIHYQTDGAALFPKGDAATVIVKNSTIETTTAYAVSTNANNNDNYNVNINLINSTLKGCSPVLINVPGFLNIDNCDIIGEMHGVVVRGGTATIKNSRITQDYTDDDSDDMYSFFDSKDWKQGNGVQLGGLIVGNKHQTSYQYSSNVTVENTVITINTPTTSKGYFPAIFTYGNSGTSLGVSLTTSDVTLQGGKMVVGNKYCIINGTDYRSSETSFPVTIE